MSKFISTRPCPICNKLMIFENDVMDGYIILYECYSCPECKYEIGVEFGVKFEHGVLNDSVEASKNKGWEIP